MKLSVWIFILILTFHGPAIAKAKKIDDYHWSGVDRVVAIDHLVRFEKTTLDKYNTRAYVVGKHTWEAMFVTFEVD